MTAPDRLLVIGVGNRDRGDDAVGPIVCDLVGGLGLPHIATLVFEGSVLDLPLHWEPDDRVVIVDAAAPAGRPGRITEVDGLETRLIVPDAVSTHTIDVGGDRAGAGARPDAVGVDDHRHRRCGVRVRRRPHAGGRAIRPCRRRRDQAAWNSANWRSVTRCNQPSWR